MPKRFMMTAVIIAISRFLSNSVIIIDRYIIFLSLPSSAEQVALIFAFLLLLTGFHFGLRFCRFRLMPVFTEIWRKGSMAASSKGLWGDTAAEG